MQQTVGLLCTSDQPSQRPLATHNTQTFMPQVGFKLTFSGERSQTHTYRLPGMTAGTQIRTHIALRLASWYNKQRHTTWARSLKTWIYKSALQHSHKQAWLHHFHSQNTVSPLHVPTFCPLLALINTFTQIIHTKPQDPTRSADTHVKQNVKTIIPPGQSITTSMRLLYHD
jgi:hypothetical protein